MLPSSTISRRPDRPSAPTSTARRLLHTALPLALGGLLLAGTGFAQGLPGRGGQTRQAPRVTGKAGSSASTQQAQELQVPLGGTARLVLKDANARSLTDVRVLDARGGKTSPSRYLTAVLGRTQRDGSRTLMIQASTRATPGTDYVLQGVMGRTTITLDVKVEVLAAGVKPAERSAARPGERSTEKPGGTSKGQLPGSVTKGRLPDPATKGGLPGTTGKGKQPGRAAVVLGRGSSTQIDLKGGNFDRILQLRVVRDGKVDSSMKVSLERLARDVRLTLESRKDAPLSGQRRIEALIDRQWQTLPIDMTLVEQALKGTEVDPGQQMILLPGGGRVVIGDRKNAGDADFTVPPTGIPVNHYVAASWGDPLYVRRAMQSFHARGEYLDSLEIRMEGGAPVLVRLLPSEEGAAALFEKVVTAPDSMDLVTIEPDAPVMLTPGMPYVVEIQTTGTSAIVGLGTTAGDVYRYGFGWARLGTSEGDYLENDFSMRVRGRRTTPLPADPTKRALLIVVENGGFGSSLEAVDMMQLEMPQVPYLCYPRVGPAVLELRMFMNENITDALARLSNDIDAYVNAQSSSYVERAQLAAAMLNPLNWRIEYEDFSEVFNILSDAILEDTMKAVHLMADSSSHYDRVVLMEDLQVKAAPVREKILELCADHQLDIHILTHGGSNKIIGCEENGTSYELDYWNFFEWLFQVKAAGTQPLCIRTVYQMNCVGGSLKDEWLGLGAVAVNGTKNLENNYMPHQYVHFIELFTNQGYTFGDATAAAYEQAVAYTKPVYDLLPREAGEENQDTVDQLLEDSRLTVVGDATVTID